VGEGTVAGADEQRGIGGELAVTTDGPGNSQSDPATVRILAALVATAHSVDSLLGDAALMM
jgi:hypothetical protein